MDSTNESESVGGHGRADNTTPRDPVFTLPKTLSRFFYICIYTLKHVWRYTYLIELVMLFPIPSKPICASCTMHTGVVVRVGFSHFTGKYEPTRSAGVVFLPNTSFTLYLGTNCGMCKHTYIQTHTYTHIHRICDYRWFVIF